MLLKYDDFKGVYALIPDCATPRHMYEARLRLKIPRGEL